MNNKKPSILFTTQLSEQKRSLLENGRLLIESIPFITFEYLMPAMWLNQVPKHADGWIFTSKKAVRAINPMIKDLIIPNHIFAVGAKTAEKLEELGLEVTIPDEYNAAALAHKMKELELKEVVHFCGNLKAADLSKLLGDSTNLYSIEVYRTKQTTHKINAGEFDGIVFMSPSAIESFSEQNSIPENMQVFCIGPTTEQAANEAGMEQCITPEYSTLDSLVKSIEEFYF
ncbi:MAG: uroporphyrinogen-III synthase [Gracilimonas sp.]|uniref:uroporphyrinogen-III synthase n=1 Tax=Gracilimonas sp. TaxID=1974203 RepID=UPI00375027B6|nr:uroporphyrinogen-III synthase [Gracilimonas sp.]